MRRVQGSPPPWTDDETIASYRFTNAYRASDRVSQFLIRNVIYSGSKSRNEVFFRVLLFKIFNRIDTWQYLSNKVERITWKGYSFDQYAEALDARINRGARLYSPAYIMPSPPFRSPRKHRNHLRLIEHMMADGAPEKIARAKTLKEVYQILLSYPSLGPFLAFQFTIDLNYSEIIDFSEMEFVVAGPGAVRGIQKCFRNTGGLSDEDLIRAVADLAPEEFARQELNFQTLWGRDLQLIDLQNLFCEVDKYARVVHPEFSNIGGRVRIKQNFKPSSSNLPQFYPPKWDIEVPERLQE